MYGLVYISYESPRGRTLYLHPVVFQNWAVLLLRCSTISTLNYSRRLTSCLIFQDTIVRGAMWLLH
jgi:hypothetical protein